MLRILLILLIPVSMSAQVDFDYCAISKDEKKIPLLICLLDGWERGYVSYAWGDGIINIESAGTELDFQPEGRPGAFYYYFDECIDETVTGRYTLYIQGANIYRFTYENYQNGKKFDFAEYHDDSFCVCRYY